MYVAHIKTFSSSYTYVLRMYIHTSSNVSSEVRLETTVSATLHNHLIAIIAIQNNINNSYQTYLFRVDIIFTAKLMSAANMGISSEEVTLASELAMFPASVIVSVSFNSLRNMVRLVTYIFMYIRMYTNNIRSSVILSPD